MLKTLLGAVSCLTLLSAASVAQDYSLDPRYGSVTLNGGFTPDPYNVNLQSGGSIDAGSRIGRSCRGFVANAPDFRLNFSAGSLPLILSVNSTADTTLIINGPDGNYYCDDDSGQGLNPSVRFNSPMSGQCDIWVGTFANSSLQNASLRISKVSSH